MTNTNQTFTHSSIRGTEMNTTSTTPIPTRHTGAFAMIRQQPAFALPRHGPARRTLTSFFAVALALGAVSPALATIDNTASVTGTAPNGAASGGTVTVTDTATENVTTETATTSYTVAKSITSVTTSNGDTATAIDGDDVITYQYVVDNTGNTSLKNVAITDPGPTFNSGAGGATLTALSGPTGDTGSDGIMGPDETWTYTATYTLTQADVDAAAGFTDGVSNTITVAADDLGDNPITVDGPGSTLTATTTIPSAPALTLAKIATKDGTNEDDGSTTAYAAGDDIIYVLTVTNSGNVTVSGMTVTETAFNGTGAGGFPTIVCATSSDATIASLAPGASETCTATYTVDEGDLL
jgi:uncharacterized repeat protein (TIGR01451 family)